METENIAAEFYHCSGLVLNFSLMFLRATCSYHSDHYCSTKAVCQTCPPENVCTTGSFLPYMKNSAGDSLMGSRQHVEGNVQILLRRSTFISIHSTLIMVMVLITINLLNLVFFLS